MIRKDVLSPWTIDPSGELLEALCITHEMVAEQILDPSDELLEDLCEVYEIVAKHIIAQAVYDRILKVSRSGGGFDKKTDRGIKVIGAFPGVGPDTMIEYNRSNWTGDERRFGYVGFNDAPIAFLKGTPQRYIFGLVVEGSFSSMVKASQRPFYNVFFDRDLFHEEKRYVHENLMKIAKRYGLPIFQSEDTPRRRLSCPQ